MVTRPIRSGLQPSTFGGFGTQGYALGWYGVAPSGLSSMQVFYVVPFPPDNLHQATATTKNNKALQTEGFVVC
ncbi:hypothetical protein AciX8_4672 [Granulicella mallensis MP5ACTX8]|uniref:Uncharacterized protein n=1 Tax=Granulicella mallensis (strain ATCC BAA-1857 / DSM 23137 / MP5ACTX8) TaxID=682795 RepID=G8NWQ5_GRAMM|nr:hypothetical protein AciX8_4672 [Granulicella mallensis MP5ACTX8]